MSISSNELKIIFMGTPEFAVASLDALVKAGFNIIAVVTAPDKPAGRGMKLQESEVKKYASKHGIKILQPEKLKNPEFLSELRSLNADLQVVVAFRMLPEVVWNMPPMGTVNVHASLLPQYRGAAPINWAIINGEKETGVTTFKLQHEIDTGNILLQETIPIEENETAGELHDRMKEISAQLLVKTVEGLADGTLQETPQLAIGNPSTNAQEQSAIENSQAQDSHSSLTTHHSSLKHAPKIFTETCRIDWHKSADEIHNLIRGLSPHPTAFTELGDKTLKIFRSEKDQAYPTSKPGRWETDRKTYLKFAAKDAYILLKDVQLEGKKRMSIEEFLRGYRF
ncbi:MAG TPA: methionyl-tRNA formyltransferase [Chitinophagaceae bacterium]|jgi:methionyl-tRNA formyltransferase|nr:methionyl-tRNA formyltransferase [Chitinophagaceae bacterium]